MVFPGFTPPDLGPAFPPAVPCSTPPPRSRGPGEPSHLSAPCLAPLAPLIPGHPGLLPSAFSSCLLLYVTVWGQPVGCGTLGAPGLEVEPMEAVCAPFPWPRRGARAQGQGSLPGLVAVSDQHQPPSLQPTGRRWTKPAPDALPARALGPVSDAEGGVAVGKCGDRGLRF